jgi:hypothetical protein
MEVPCTVVFLPVVVDHQHAGRKTLGDDVAGIAADAILSLVVNKLDPGIVLWLDKEQLVRDLAIAGEEGAADVLEGRQKEILAQRKEVKRETFERRRRYNQEVRDTLKRGATSPQSLGSQSVQNR